MNNKLKINSVFQTLSYPYSKEEFAKLEEGIMKEGCLEPIIIWHGTIIDGHKRYKICIDNGLPYESRDMDFGSEDDAVIWACKRRIGNFDKDNRYHRYLIGKWYIAQKNINKRNRKPVIKECEPAAEPDYEDGKDAKKFIDTSAQVASEVGTTRSIVQVGGDYADAMDKIRAKDFELFESFIRDEIPFGFNTVIGMAKLSRKKIDDMVMNRLFYLDKEASKKNAPKEKTKEDEVQLKTGIKEMPAYDPDREINGLLYTIPTWVAQIIMTERKAQMDLVTDKAKDNLRTALKFLKNRVEIALSHLNENDSKDAGDVTGFNIGGIIGSDSQISTETGRQDDVWTCMGKADTHIGENDEKQHTGNLEHGMKGYECDYECRVGGKNIEISTDFRRDNADAMLENVYYRLNQGLRSNNSYISPEREGFDSKRSDEEVSG